MSWLPRRLARRVAVAAALAAALSMVVSGVLLSADVGRDGRAAVDAALRQRMRALQRVLGSSDGALLTPGRAPGVRTKALAGLRSAGLPNLLVGSGEFSRIIDQSGTVLAAQGDSPPPQTRIATRPGSSEIAIRGAPWRILTVTTGGGFALQVASTLKPVNARVHHTQWLVLTLGLMAVLVTAVGSLAFTSLTLRPLLRLRRAAAGVSTTADLSQRLRENDGPEETRALSVSLNRMLERLQSSVLMTETALGATRQFAADVGHELRTPLTTVRATLDTLQSNPDLAAEDRQAALEEVSAETLRAINLLEALQTLARGDAGAILPRERLDLADIVDAAIHAARARHPQHSVNLGHRGDHAIVNGWPDGLRAILDNLLENAASHGGHAITVTVLRTNGGVSIVVEDDGPGVSGPDRQRIFNRFTRGEAAQGNGSGLGLAIVAQQASLHGGKVHVERSNLGGANFTVTLPVAPADNS